MHMYKISAVIITFNASRTIAACLDAVLQVADEVIVVDSFSTDNTIQICQQKEAKVIQQKWLGFGPQKNLGNLLASFDYILSIDADEVLSPALIQMIKELKNTQMASLYSMVRVNSYFGKFIYFGQDKPTIKERLFNKKEIKWNDDLVHERLIIPADVKAVRLSGEFYHYSYDSITQYVEKSNDYTTLAARDMCKKGVKVSWIKLHLAPIFTFIKSYFLMFGFLDGRHGYIVARLSAQTKFLKYSKLWDVQRTSK